MSGKYNSLKNIMFINPQPIYSEYTEYIKGIVIPRRGDGYKISKDEAKKILKNSIRNLNYYWGVPYNVEYLEPIKDFVYQESDWRWEEFVLSTLINNLNKNKKILKQRVWFFELKNYVKAEDF